VNALHFGRHRSIRLQHDREDWTSSGIDDGELNNFGVGILTKDSGAFGVDDDCIRVSQSLRRPLLRGLLR
jgi:hypothetical protein